MKKKHGVMRGILLILLICLTGCGSFHSADRGRSADRSNAEGEKQLNETFDGKIKKEDKSNDIVREPGNDESTDGLADEVEEVTVNEKGENVSEGAVGQKPVDKDTTEADTMEPESAQNGSEVGKIEAHLLKEHYAGDVLVAADFQVKVTMPDGRVLMNPRGWTATPLELAKGDNDITVAYDMLRTVIHVSAAVRTELPAAGQTEDAMGNPVTCSGNQTFALSGPAVLMETVDMGQEYIDKMIFLGDSRTYSYKAYGVLSGGKDTTQVWAPRNGTMSLSAQGYGMIVYPETGEDVTIRDAVAIKQPGYLVIGLGANGVSFMGEEAFKREYRALVNDIKEISPDTKIILNSIFPIAHYYARQDLINTQKIVECNRWIMEIAEETGTKYLNAAEALVNEDGFLNDSYDNHGDGMHLNRQGNEVVMQYIRTHAYP